jgi:cryptochrome
MAILVSHGSGVCVETSVDISGRTDCQRDLSSSLTKLNKKQKLHLIREAPQTVFPKLFELWKITHLVFEKDTDAYARDRDKEVMKLAEDAGVEVVVRVGRTLYDPDELVRHNGGRPTMSMSQTQKAAQPLGDPAKPIPAPKFLPDPGDADLSSIDHQKPDPSPDFNSAHRKLDKKESQYKSIMGPNKDFAVPTLEEMGIEAATTPHRGGETIALKMLDDICKNEDYTGTFEKPKSAPTDFNPPSTTLLSPHHHFGSLSIREFWWRVDEVYQKRKKNKKPNSSIPENLHGQLLFRDMYFGAQAALGQSFAQEVGNKVCKFVDWHLRSNISKTPVGEHLLAGDYVVDNPEAEIWFQRWKGGVTGFPWIDALMRQLRLEGWIHHLGRHAVACFLTRGGCYVHWERGAEVFEEWLIDHETACNVGNWMWLSCTAFYSQFYRCYSPIAFPKKTDVNGDFVRRFVPELREYDKKYIYEPWRAPVADQKRWGCLVKGDGTVTEEGKLTVYPKPMFDFNDRRTFCIDAIKNAYRMNLHGDDPKVLDGRWKEIFGYKIEGEGRRKDETNGEDVDGERPRKQAKADPGKERDDDRVGAEGGDGDAADGEESMQRPAAKRRRGGKEQQATLDQLVTRKKAKK